MTRRSNLPRSFDELAGLRARGLIRESTVEQGENSGPIIQEREEQAFAERWRLQGPDRFYTDLVSGSDALKRPQFLQMIADAKAGEFDVLLVRETSRFARNWRQAGGYEEQLHAAGVVVAYIYEGRLSNDRAGQLQLVVNHAVNEEYREKLIDNVRKGYRVKRFEAGKFSGTPPIGYVMGYEDVRIPGPKGYERRETGVLAVDNEAQPRIAHGDTYTRAELVRLIGRLYASGRFGHGALAAHLNLEGYRNVKGAPFSKGSIRHLLESPTYAGFLSWHHRKDKRLRGEADELVRGPHEPLWTDEMARQIAAVTARQFRGSNGGRLRYVYPFRRLAVCDRCGRRLQGEAHDGIPYMACIIQRQRHDCEQKAIRSKVMEDQVSDWLITLRIPDDWREDLERMQRRIAADADSRPAIDRTAIQTQLDRLNDLYIMGNVNREEYVGRQRALDASLRGGPEQPRYSEAVMVRAKRLLDEMGELWRKATPEERTELMQGLFAEVRVRDRKIIHATPAHDEYRPLLAIAQARGVSVAPPDGSGHARQTFAIEGVDELVAALLAA